VGTDGPGGGKFETPHELVTRVVNLWPATGGKPFVVCTGGEPLLQLDGPLVDALHTWPRGRCPQRSATCLTAPPTSPFYGLIRRSSDGGKRPDAVVADASVVKVIEESLSSASGGLFPYRNVATSEIDADGIMAVLVVYWSGVKKVFPDAWGKPPAKSRRMHGAGIRAMGRLMDRVMAGVNPRDPKAVAIVERELRLVAPVCRWTSGHWEGLNGWRWDRIENTPRQVRELSSLLIRTYLQASGRMR
jgi:hypothetical protein